MHENKNKITLPVCIKKKGKKKEGDRSDFALQAVMRQAAARTMNPSEIDDDRSLARSRKAMTMTVREPSVTLSLQRHFVLAAPQAMTMTINVSTAFLSFSLWCLTIDSTIDYDCCSIIADIELVLVL